MPTGMETNANGRAASYTPDDSNQYDERAMPRFIDVPGSAASGSTVKVEGQPATRLGDYFHHALDLSTAGSVNGMIHSQDFRQHAI